MFISWSWVDLVMWKMSRDSFTILEGGGIFWGLSEAVADFLTIRCDSWTFLRGFSAVFEGFFFLFKHSIGHFCPPSWNIRDFFFRDALQLLKVSRSHFRVLRSQWITRDSFGILCNCCRFLSLILTNSKFLKSHFREILESYFWSRLRCQ